MDCDRILSNAYADLIVDFAFNEEIFPPADMEKACYQQVDDTYTIVYALRNNNQTVSIGRYAYQINPNLYGLMQSQNIFDPTSLIESGIIQVQRPPLSLTGKGVILAFIDTGIDYTQPAFLDANGNSRILAIWDQTIQTGEPPKGFLYGTEYKREQINEALKATNPYDIVPTRDELRHGTSMAGVAAASRVEGGNGYIGAAPDAGILVVKLKQCKPYLRVYNIIPEEVPAFAENDIMLGVKYAESFAITFERPVVICIGLGSNQGDHTGSTPLSRYLSNVAAKRSRAVVIGGGNEGNAGHHYVGSLKQGNGGRENYKDVEIRVGEGTKGFIMEVWGSIPDIFNLSVRSPGGETIPATRIGTGQGITYGFIFESTKLTIDSVLVEQGTGEELILLRFQDPTPGIWTLRVTAIGQVYNGTFHAWLPITQFMTGDTYFLEPSPYTTMTDPSLSQDAISVSTYNDKNISFYQESGRGFGRNGLVKPDLSAPGVNISTLYGAETGSSLAAAITAGGVAQFMQWAVVEANSTLMESIELKNYFIRGATRSADTFYPSREWGFGRLNVAGTFDVLAGL